MNTKDLMSAVDELPLILEEKKRLEEHGTLMSHLMEFIKQRKIPNMCSIEEDLISHFLSVEYKAKKTGIRNKVVDQKLLDRTLGAIGDPTLGNLNDILRLCSICILTQDVDSSQVQMIHNACKEAFSSAEDSRRGNVSIDQVDRKIDLLQKLFKAKNRLSSSTTSSLQRSISKASTNEQDWAGQATNLLSRAAANVQNALTSDKLPPLCRFTNALIHGNHDILQEIEQTRGLDFKDPQKMNVKSSLSSIDVQGRDIVLFCIGGITISETIALRGLMQTANENGVGIGLDSFASGGGRRKLVVGGTEVLTPESFLDQLTDSLK